MEEREIDLRMLFYKMLTKWRCAILLGIIFGLAAAAYALIGDLSVYLNEDAYNAAYAAYLADQNNLTADRLELESKVDTLTASKARREEYKVKSVLMKVDPMNVYVGTLPMYVSNAGDSLGRVIAAYTAYMTGGELYRTILDNTSIVSDTKYLLEIFSTSFSVDTATITVTVKGACEADVNEILAIVYDATSEKAATIAEKVGVHELEKGNETVLTQVDRNLITFQSSYDSNLTNYKKTIDTATQNLNQLSASSSTPFNYTVSAIAKHAIKMLIIGGVAGVFVAFGWTAVLYVLTHRIMDDTFWTATGFTYLGAVWETPNRHKTFKKIDALVDRICGVPALSGGLAESSALVGAHINGMMKNSNIDKIAVIGTESAEQMKNAVAEMKKQIAGEIFYAGNILTSADAISLLNDCDKIIIAATETVTTTDDIFRQKELLKLWGKDLVGAISFK